MCIGQKLTRAEQLVIDNYKEAKRLAALESGDIIIKEPVTTNNPKAELTTNNPKAEIRIPVTQIIV